MMIIIIMREETPCFSKKQQQEREINSIDLFHFPSNFFPTLFALSVSFLLLCASVYYFSLFTSKYIIFFMYQFYIFLFLFIV